VHTYMPIHVPYKRTKERHTTLTADQLICARELLYLALAEGKPRVLEMNPARVLVQAPRERPLEGIMITLCYLQTTRNIKVRTMLHMLSAMEGMARVLNATISDECVEFLEKVDGRENWLATS
jgi:hypothetical protein